MPEAGGFKDGASISGGEAIVNDLPACLLPNTHGFGRPCPPGVGRIHAVGFAICRLLNFVHGFVIGKQSCTNRRTSQVLPETTWPCLMPVREIVPLPAAQPLAVLTAASHCGAIEVLRPERWKAVAQLMTGAET